MTRSERMRYRKDMFAKMPHCFWCNARMILEPNHRNRGAIEDMATIEHLRQKKNGGSDKAYNLRLVHKRCNK